MESTGERQPLGSTLPDFALPPLAGGAAPSLAHALAGRQGGVVVFWSSVCSHCARYDGYLNGFAARYPKVVLLAVASRAGETAEQLRAACAERGLAFPLVHDADRAVARGFLVEQTPRVFLLDAKRVLHYRGAIDNFKIAGDPEHRPYLEEALGALLAGRPVLRAETPSFGCPIESVYYSLPRPRRPRAPGRT